MLTGRKGREVEALACQRVLRAKKKGFSLLELLIVGFILSIVTGALFFSLTAGGSASSLGLAKADLQAKVRLAMDWIVKDVRQASLIQINTNSPSGDHIKFKKVTGIDGAGNYAFSTDYTEYSYDSVSGNLTRSEVDNGGSVLRSLTFNNIIQSPFYTTAGVALTQSPNPGNILEAKKLIIVISAQSQVRNSRTLNFSLTEEAKIRNP